MGRRLNLENELTQVFSLVIVSSSVGSSIEMELSMGYVCLWQVRGARRCSKNLFGTRKEGVEVTWTCNYERTWLPCLHEFMTASIQLYIIK